MTGRASQEDTQADREVRTCINSSPPQNFVMTAGAGSGKTTSLVKALNNIVIEHGDMLRRKRQRVACITYTEIAAEEIWSEIGNPPLVHVSTIHSFFWTLVRPFQRDIKVWVALRVKEKIEELREAASNFGPRVQQRTKDKNQKEIDRYSQIAGKIAAVPAFTYGVGSDYTKGVLGHDDIVKMVPHLISDRPLFQKLLAQQFPFIFVDENRGPGRWIGGRSILKGPPPAVPYLPDRHGGDNELPLRPK